MDLRTHVAGVGWVTMDEAEELDRVARSREQERISILDWGWGWVDKESNMDADQIEEKYGRTKPIVDQYIHGVESDGGPSAYFDFPKGAVTLNDLIEHKGMNFHLGNIFKACWRWGTKKGVSKAYDARKIIYSGCRLLMMEVGVEGLRQTLQDMLDDPQFKEREK